MVFYSSTIAMIHGPINIRFTITVVAILVLTLPIIPVIQDAFVFMVIRNRMDLSYNHVRTSPEHYSVTGNVFPSAVVDSH